MPLPLPLPLWIDSFENGLGEEVVVKTVPFGHSGFFDTSWSSGGGQQSHRTESLLEAGGYHYYIVGKMKAR